MANPSKPFLWYNTAAITPLGLIASAITVMTTELNNLANGSSALSSVNGSSGVFNSTSFAQAVWADIFLNIGGPNLAGTLAAGANVAGWFLPSPDGTVYEWSQGNTIAPPRPPDFIIPLPAATSLAAASIFKSAGMVLLNPTQQKLIIQNNSGQTLSPSTTASPYIKIAPYGMGY